MHELPVAFFAPLRPLYEISLKDADSLNLANTPRSCAMVGVFTDRFICYENNNCHDAPNCRLRSLPLCVKFPHKMRNRPVKCRKYTVGL